MTPAHPYKLLVEGLIVLGATIFLALAYLHIQEPNDVSKSLQSDEVQYRNMAIQFRADEAIVAIAPSVYRVGSPYIVSNLPIEDISDAYLYWEMSCAILAVLLLYFWLRLHLQSRIFSFFFIALTICTLWGPIRATTYHIHGIEGSTILVLMCSYLALYQYHRTKSVAWVLLLAMTSAVGATVREFCLVPALGLLFLYNPLTSRMFADIRPWVLLPILARVFFNRDRLILWLPLASGFAALAVVHAQFTPTDNWNYLNHAAWGLSNLGPLRYLASIFNALGPLPLIVFFIPGFVPTFLRQHQMFSIILATFLLMSWSGYSNERYFVWVMPIIFVMIGRAMERHLDVIRSWPTMLLIVVFELIAVRAFFPIMGLGPKLQRPIAEEALSRYLPDGWHLSEMEAYAAEPKAVLTNVIIGLAMGGILWLAVRSRIPRLHEESEPRDAAGGT